MANRYSLASDAPQGWKTSYVLVLLLLGLLLMTAFVVWEIKYPYAMIDMAVWKDRDFSLVRILTLLLYITKAIQLFVGQGVSNPSKFCV